MKKSQALTFNKAGDHTFILQLIQTILVSAETNNLLWDVNLPKGVYILTVLDGQDTFIQKLLVD